MQQGNLNKRDTQSIDWFDVADSYADQLGLDPDDHYKGKDQAGAQAYVAEMITWLAKAGYTLHAIDLELAAALGLSFDDDVLQRPDSFGKLMRKGLRHDDN